jgi:hypothetical protein
MSVLRPCRQDDSPVVLADDPIVPDFIPVVGYADDALIIAIAMRSVTRVAGPEAKTGTGQELRTNYILSSSDHAQPRRACAASVHLSLSGHEALSSIMPSDIQAWVKRLENGHRESGQAPLSPATIGVAHSVLSSVLKSAVRDRRISSNPSEGTKLPKSESKRVKPPTTADIHALHASCQRPTRPW